MKKYKINRDQPPVPPSKETIAKYKNFAQLSHEYDRLTKKPKVPLYKDKKMFLILLLIVAVAFVIAQMDDEETKNEDGTSPLDTTIRINN